VNLKKNVFLRGIVSLVLVLFSLFLSTSVTKANSPYPITGTFVMIDNFLRQSPPQDVGVTNWVGNMHELGVDTLIMLVFSFLKADSVKVCASGSFTVEASSSNPIYRHVIEEAKSRNMSVYFGLLGVDTTKVSQYPDSNPNSETSICARKIIDLNIQTAKDVRNWVINNYGSSFWQNNVKGFYLNEDEVSKVEYKDFIRNVITGIKMNPDLASKKIIISPWKREGGSYYKDFLDFYRMGVDVLAPQDGLGARLVKTYSSNSKQFEELKRARDDAESQGYRGKEAWANVESFDMFSFDSNYTYKPTSISTLKDRIDSSRPYVTKQITWIFQHSLTTIKELYQMSTWNNQYNPENAIRRQQLRNSYIATYNPSKSHVESYFVWYSNLVAKGNLGAANRGVDIGVLYIDKNGSFKTHFGKYNVYQEDKPTIYIPLSVLPGFEASRLHVVFVNDLNYAAGALFTSDLNNDGKVDIFDYNILVSDFGKTGVAGFTKSDINKDGKVDIFDYNILVGDFGK